MCEHLQGHVNCTAHVTCVPQENTYPENNARISEMNSILEEMEKVEKEEELELAVKLRQVEEEIQRKTEVLEEEQKDSLLEVCILHLSDYASLDGWSSGSILVCCRICIHIWTRRVWQRSEIMGGCTEKYVCAPHVCPVHDGMCVISMLLSYTHVVEHHTYLLFC